jgi:hypothetical protein
MSYPAFHFDVVRKTISLVKIISLPWYYQDSLTPFTFIQPEFNSSVNKSDFSPLSAHKETKLN